MTLESISGRHMGDRLSKKQINLAEYKTTYLVGGLEGRDASSFTPILFLHGWGTTTLPYRKSLNLLCQQYSIFAPELPGFGKCAHPTYVPDYISYANPLVAFLQALNIPKVHIVGHSGGGAVAIALAVTAPSLVRSIVISDSTGIPLGSLPNLAFRRAVEIVLQTPKFKPLPILQFSQSLLYNCLFKTHNLIQATRIALEKDLRPFLPQIQAPTLVLWAGNDRFIPRQQAYEFSEHIPGAQLIIAEGEYHEWAMFRPEKFVPLIIDFLNEVEQEPAQSHYSN